MFVLQHAAVLALLLVIAAATGTAVASARVPLALRSALGLAVAGQVFAILGALGVLRPWTICIFVAISLVGLSRIQARVRRRRRVAVARRLFYQRLTPKHPSESYVARGGTRT